MGFLSFIFKGERKCSYSYGAQNIQKWYKELLSKIFKQKAPGIIYVNQEASKTFHVCDSNSPMCRHSLHFIMTL